MTLSRLICSETDLQNRLLVILEGISQDLKDSDIAAQLGVDRWLIQKDVRLMQYNRDPRLKQAESSREVVRSEKMMHLAEDTIHAKQNEMFLHMTGISLEERSFRNMIDFYKANLVKITKAEDPSTAIMVLPKRDRMTMVNNGILSGRRGSLATWRITKRAREYLAIAH